MPNDDLAGLQTHSKAADHHISEKYRHRRGRWEEEEWSHVLVARCVENLAMSAVTLRNGYE